MLISAGREVGHLQRLDLVIIKMRLTMQKRCF